MSGHLTGRRVSSLSLTYQEKFQKQLPTPATSVAIGNAFYRSTDISFVPQLPSDQALDDEFEVLSNVHELSALPGATSSTSTSSIASSSSSLSSSFYPPPPPPPLSYPMSSTLLEHSRAIPYPQPPPPAQPYHPQQLHQEPPPHLPPPSHFPPPAHPSLPPPSCAVSWPVVNPLYELEDGLRHKINVQIENFRASVQLSINDQFNCYRFSRSADTKMETDVSSYMEQGAGDGCEGGGGEEVECGVQQQHRHPSVMESCSGNYLNQDDSIYSSGASSTDSGIGGQGADSEEPSLERQLDQCVIQLQTLASIVSNTLRRTEYSLH